MTADIAEGVKTILVHHLGVEEAWITERTKLIEDLRADSLDVIEIAMTVEEAFNVRIPDWVADRFVTVGDVIAYVAAEGGQHSREVAGRGVRGAYRARLRLGDA